MNTDIINDEDLMLKHLDVVSSDVPAKKNALITYSYNNNEKDKEYYNPKDMNIGDYIQSLAAAQFFPEPCDTFLDRDFLSLYEGEKVNVFLNAWWYIWKKNKSFSENIRPLFVAFHFNNYENVPSETRDFLRSHNIEAYFGVV